MSVLEQPFMQDFLQCATDGYALGWHEANGGNLSYRLKPEEKAQIKHHSKPGRWNALDDLCLLPELAGDCLLITASGSNFRSMGTYPKKCAGIIEINSKGNAYRSIWGFKGGGSPTSELSTHLMLQALKKSMAAQATGVVYHAHPSEIVAMSSVIEGSAAKLTRDLWGAMSEAPIVFPEGVGLVGWMVPGSMELALATADQMMRHDAVVWSHHGLIAYGPTFDKAFGLIHTIEKSAKIHNRMKMLAGTHDEKEDFLISGSDLSKLSKALSLDLDIEGDYIGGGIHTMRNATVTLPLNLI